MDFKNLFSLQGRVALITGGSRGIGEMLLEGYLAAGCERVYITARKAQQLEETADKFGDKVVGLPGDISRMEGIEELADEIGRREQRLDILVNNAGAAWGEEFEGLSREGLGQSHGPQRQDPVLPHPEAARPAQGCRQLRAPAKVINIASIDGLRPNPWETYPYQASKAGLIHLTKRMAARLIHDNIVVSCIAPGAYPSEMNKAAARNPKARLGASPRAGWAWPRTSPAARSISPAAPATTWSARRSRSTAGWSTPGSPRTSRIRRAGTDPGAL
jgi:NAD(P)-dependent dehydrogenase (short-subunit alcohol dehydrogenase family)